MSKPTTKRVKAVNLLRMIRERLANMTTDDFAKGVDRDIRDAIDAYLSDRP